MQNNFIWLSAETVTEINKIVVADSGEPHVLLDHMKLEGALQRPYNICEYGGEEDAFRLSLHYMVSIAEAHAFLQGNKRTGFAAGRTFLQAHGYDLIMPDVEETAQLFVRVIEHESDLATFETHLEQFVTDYVEQE